VFAARVLFSWIDEGRSRGTKRESLPSSVWRRNRYRTISRWSEMRPTGTRHPGRQVYSCIAAALSTHRGDSSSRPGLACRSGSTDRTRSLRENYELALLFRELATLRTDVPVFDSVDQLHWRGPTPAFEAIGRRLGAAVTDKWTAPRARLGQARQHDISTWQRYKDT
jgi:hypothetical protein